MRRRQAFTLVELLVVIVVIAILVALLIPAVQSAREASRRITCANHLKLFALAAANYASANKDRLPPTVLEFFGASGRRRLPKGRWKCDAWIGSQSPGWRVAVLPFLEEQSLYDQFDFSQGVVTASNFAAVSHVLTVFQCPSTPGYPRSIAQSKDRISSRVPNDLMVGAFDYGIPARSWQQLNENGEREGLVPAWNGVKYRQSVLRADLGVGCVSELEFGRGAKLVWATDGLSQTTLAHEVAYLPNLFNRDGVRASVDGRVQDIGRIKPQSTGTSWAQHYTIAPHAYKPINSTNTGSRFSFHPGGAHNAFLDGSVRFLDDSTDVIVVRDLTSRDAEGARMIDE